MTEPGLLRCQRGAAIVTAMLVVTLTAVIVASLFWREHVATRSVENRLALAQTRWIQRAALDWARVILQADFKSGVVDHLGEPWAVPVMDTRIDETVAAGVKLDDRDGTALLAGQIQDAQARFNLINLVDNNGQPSQACITALNRLVLTLGRSQALADAIFDRVKQSRPRHIAGQRVPAERPPLMRLTDLLDTPGIDWAALTALMPHVVVLPQETRVNLNTASAEVLSAVITTQNLADARRFVAGRERTFYRSLPHAALAFVGQPTLDPDLLAVGSSFFLVSGVIRFGRVEAQSETLLERDPSSGKVSVVWQMRR